MHKMALVLPVHVLKFLNDKHSMSEELNNE